MILEYLQRLDEIFLLEAIHVNDAKYFIKQGREVNFKNLYPELFTTGKDRIYFNFEPSVDPSGEVFPEIKDYLETKNFRIIDYRRGIAQEDDPPKEKEIIDPITKQKKKVKIQPRKIRIGVLLKDNPELQKEYNDDKTRQGSKTKKYSIVISRHPYDIAGMSTGRSWFSCANLQGGSCIVSNDIKHGSLIAYLIDVNDKNIKRPLARVMIKPYYNTNQNKFLHTTNLYGIESEEFVEKVQSIINQTINKNIEIAGFIHPKLYTDDEKFQIDPKIDKEKWTNQNWDKLINEPDWRNKIPHFIFQYHTEFQKQYTLKHWDRLLNEPDQKNIPDFVLYNHPEFWDQWKQKQKHGVSD